MKHVCIVGLGLIGGSLGMSLRRVRRNGKRQYHVHGLGRNLAALKLAKQRGAVDDYSVNPAHSVPDADIVVFGIPVQATAASAQKILRFVKAGAVLTDAGSVKFGVEQDMKKILSRRKDIQFVGSHPLAGSEKAGIVHAQNNLFEKATVVVTPGRASFSSLKNIKDLWSDVGGHCLLLSSKEHDAFLALTSHLPHILAFSLFQMAHQISKNKPVIKSLIAGSFRDLTRVASSDPDVWSGIFQMNRTELKRVTRKFMSHVAGLISTPQGQWHSRLEKISRAKKGW